MQRLIEGVHRFRREEFGRYRELFARLSREGQNPHTLFITCSDSRVLAELVTQSQPGDLFVVKNLGNIVPPSAVSGSTNSTAAAIEFAVHVLGVGDIVVCGHTQCGAMTALLNGLPNTAAMPHAAAWLEVAAPVREIVEREYKHLNAADCPTAAAAENVLLALENLHAYPVVAERLTAGNLRLHGWCFKIDTAEMFAYDPFLASFSRLWYKPAMAYDSLRDFVQKLDAAGELKRISVEVDPVLEITEIADREMKLLGGGKALLFEKCKGSQFPLLINAYGSTKRMAMALGVNDVEEIASELEGLLKAKPPTSFKEAIGLLGTAFELRHAKPKSVRSGACKEVVQQKPNVNALPIQKCWPQDAGRFICLPLVITRDPDTGARNVGTYRMQVIDERTTFMHWQLHKTGARHWRRYMELKQRMPVAVALGGDPVYTFAATAPLPDGIDEMMLAGFLRKKSVEMVKCDTNDLEVPADCDFVLEGYVDPEEKLDLEGPFGDHTGYYTLPEPYPKFHIERITHRRDAVYPSTIVGAPPMEDFYMGTASVRIFLPVFKTNFNEIVDMALPAEGAFHNLVIVSIKKQFPYHAMKVMHGLWGMGQMMFTKIIVVVDADVNVHDTNEVLFRLTANIDPERDIIFTKGPADVLDHATPVMGFGSKIGIDATHKMKGEANARPWPPIIKMDDAVKKRVDELLRHAAQ